MSNSSHTTIAANLRDLHEDVARACAAAGRTPDEVTLIAVSKTHPVGAVREAYEAGARHFGENKAQELAHKAPELSGLDLEWHMIGHLQSNKVRAVLPWAGLIHSVDRASLIDEIARRAEHGGPTLGPVRLLVQVNTTGEAAKSGADPDEIDALLERIQATAALRVEGFMTMGPLDGTEAANRAAFARLRAVRERAASQFPKLTLPILSMGMSGDFREAILEGATHIRVGTRIFGDRKRI